MISAFCYAGAHAPVTSTMPGWPTPRERSLVRSSNRLTLSRVERGGPDSARYQFVRHSSREAMTARRDGLAVAPQQLVAVCC